MENRILADSENLLRLLPQRPPFVMVDCLYHCDEKSVRTGFKPSAENIFSQEGFFTEPGLIENMAQSAAAGTGYFYTAQNKPVPVGFIGAVKNFKLFRQARVGELLITDIEVVTEVMNASVVRATVRHHDELVATGELRIFLTNPGR